MTALALWVARDPTRLRLRRATAVGAALVLGSLAAFAPFHVAFDPATHGLGWVRPQTRTLDFLHDELEIYALPAWVLGGVVLWRVAELARRHRHTWVAVPAFVLVVAAAPPVAAKALLVCAGLALALHGALRARDSAALRVFWLLVAAGFAAATVTEFVYVRDFNDGTPAFRLITVFKLGDQAWVLLALAAAYALVSAPRWLPGGYRRVWLAGTAMLAAGTAVWPVVALSARLSANEAGPTLDGMRWLERQQPGDARAIDWLRAHVGGAPVVLEAVGEGGLHARVATFTGLPTVIGWPGHERQWNHPAGTRPKDVASIYRTTDAGEARGLLARYRVRYVVLGSVERAEYPGPGLEKFATIASPVFSSAGTAVYRVSRARSPPRARAARPR
jgi:uncharacterized membrane protein